MVRIFSLGVFCLLGRVGHLHWIDFTLTQRVLCGEGVILQSPNTPQSFARTTQRPEMTVMDFPPRPLDLNPIKHSWAEHKKKHNSGCAFCCKWSSTCQKTVLVHYSSNVMSNLMTSITIWYTAATSKVQTVVYNLLCREYVYLYASRKNFLRHFPLAEGCAANNIIIIYSVTNVHFFKDFKELFIQN